MTDTQADLTERAPFDITEADIGRYARRRSTGFVGLIVRDPGNGWLHPDLYYEWKAIRDELEYVTVLDAAALQSGREAAAAEARRAVSGEAAQILDDIIVPRDGLIGWGVIANAAEAIRRLASSPAPQEEKMTEMICIVAVLAGLFGFILGGAVSHFIPW